MSTTITRRDFTNFLLSTARAVDLSDVAGVPDTLLVGDMTIPVGSGWTDQPNAPGSSFIPYVILLPLTGSPVAGAEGLGGDQPNWTFPYGIQSFGVTRDQAEFVADLIRGAYTALLHEIFTFPDADYECQKVDQVNIGGVNRVASVDPAYFGQTDQMTFWLGKRKNRRP